MERFLLDTNVVSEIKKSRPHPQVLQFFSALHPAQTFVSVMTLGELRKGVGLRSKRDPATAQALSAWIDGLEASFQERILPVLGPVARLWGELSVGRSRPVVDTLLAATAIHHQLTLVTRNMRDMEDLQVTLHNPWNE